MSRSDHTGIFMLSASFMLCCIYLTYTWLRMRTRLTPRDTTRKYPGESAAHVSEVAIPLDVVTPVPADPVPADPVPEDPVDSTRALVDHGANFRETHQPPQYSSTVGTGYPLYPALLFG